jgi:hypothetical protein
MSVKKAYITLSLVLLSCITVAQTDRNALGIRFGVIKGDATQISFQRMIYKNRVEMNLGWGNYDDYKYWSLTTIYQFIIPVKEGLKWYLGLGPSYGSRVERNTNNSYQSGEYLSAALNSGLEYNFKDIPIQVSFDIRPELGVINPAKEMYLGFGVAVRYRF